MTIQTTLQAVLLKSRPVENTNEMHDQYVGIPEPKSLSWGMGGGRQSSPLPSHLAQGVGIPLKYIATLEVLHTMTQYMRAH